MERNEYLPACRRQQANIIPQYGQTPPRINQHSKPSQPAFRRKPESTSSPALTTSSPWMSPNRHSGASRNPRPNPSAVIPNCGFTFQAQRGGGEYCGGRPVAKALPGRIVVRLNCSGELRRPDLFKSVQRGRNCRSRPLAFSIPPFCHGDSIRSSAAPIAELHQGSLQMAGRAAVSGLRTAPGLCWD